MRQQPQRSACGGTWGTLHTYLIGGRPNREQARWVKTVKVGNCDSKSFTDQTVGDNLACQSRVQAKIARDWVTCRSAHICVSPSEDQKASSSA